MGFHSPDPSNFLVFTRTCQLGFSYGGIQVGSIGESELQERMTTTDVTIHITENILLITNLDAFEKHRIYTIYLQEHQTIPFPYLTLSYLQFPQSFFQRRWPLWSNQCGKCKAEVSLEGQGVGHSEAQPISRTEAAGPTGSPTRWKVWVLPLILPCHKLLRDWKEANNSAVPQFLHLHLDPITQHNKQMLKWEQPGEAE